MYAQVSTCMCVCNAYTVISSRNTCMYALEHALAFALKQCVEICGPYI
jgi:hypothetical protein